jgi:hypothetical protein
VVARGDAQPRVAVDDLRVRAAIGMSASSPATRPAPTAGPCSALTIGLSQLMTL